MATEHSVAFDRLVKIMDELREGCPWDKKQTIQTLRPLSIEELYELVDAISAEDWKGIEEEIGDMLLHLVFYAKIATEQHQFTLASAIHKICDKLVHRHPHIYGDLQVENEEEVKKNWEKLKLKEGKTSVLSGVPNALPAMIKATRLQEKAKQVGFEWDHIDDVWAKVKEEMDELQEAVRNQQKKQIEEEFGDLLFSLVNYARFLQIDAESALASTNQKFKDRFVAMETLATQRGLVFSDLSLEQQDQLWNEIKHQK